MAADPEEQDALPDNNDGNESGSEDCSISGLCVMRSFFLDDL